MARLVFTDASNQQRAIHLGPNQPVVSVGRATDCTIRSNRRSLSRHHAEFRYNDGTYEIVDLNSSNGTWIVENDQRFEIAHERLEDEDEVWCGDFILHFYLEDSSEEELTINQNEDFNDTKPHSALPHRPTMPPDSADFDDESSEVQLDEAPVQLGAQESSVAWEHEEADQLGESDLVEVEPDDDDASQLERLLEEKQSIEDLASRQAVELQELERSLSQAQERIDQLEAELDQPQASGEQTGVGGIDVDTMRQKLIDLERLADAFERTDLGPLSTVDRIRLQSAVRETQPMQTLQELLDMLE